MRRVRAALWRLAEIFTKSRRERDLAAEIDSHLAQHMEANVRAGMAPADARRDAVLKLGGVEQAKERYRDRRGFPWLDQSVQDVRYAARVLRKNPGFASVAVLTLALGIGANTAIFSVVNAVLLRPLPFPHASELVQIFGADSRRGNGHDVASYPDYEDWRAGSASFERMTAFVVRTLLVTDSTNAELVRAARISPTFFDTFGVQPALGRAFRADENEEGRSHVALLNDGYWKRRFASDPAVLGTTLHVDDQPYTIVGVMPPDFHISPRSPEQIYTPLVPDPNRGHGFLSVVGRLRKGRTIAQARSELAVVAARLARAYPRTNATTSVNLVPLLEAMAGPARLGLLMLLAVVGLVLLIACTNVANLLLSRAAARRRELTVRAALGAGRGRLARQLLTESLILSLAGGAVGLVVARWSDGFLVALLAQNFVIPRLDETTIDASVLIFTFVVAAATGVAFGVAPALAASSPDLIGGLHDSSRSTTAGAASRRLRGVLVVGEIAMALVLLAGAGALLKTLMNMRATEPGFQTDHVLVVDMWLPQPRYAKLPDRLEFFGTVLDRLRMAPEVRSAALVADLPLGGGSDGLGFHIVGRPDPAPGQTFSARFNLASTDYFRTMGIPLRAGREFSKDDVANAQGVVVINEAAAHQFWPGESAIGRQIDLPGEAPVAPEEHMNARGASARPNPSTLLTVVGVTGDVHQSTLTGSASPEFFLHTQQANLPWPWLVLVVKAVSADPLTLASTIKSVSRAADPVVPVQRIQTMDDVLSKSMAEPRVYALLLGLFAALAVTLAAIGLYGVISYGVSQRTHELGIRLALGAERGEIVRLVLRQGLTLAGLGAAIGLACALVALRALAGALRGVQAVDPLTLLLVTTTLLAVAAAACYVPARRAARVSPVTALRAD